MLETKSDPLIVKLASDPLVLGGGKVPVGRVVVPVEVVNLGDELNANEGRIEPSQVRRETVQALVDTGARAFSLPASVIERLGLQRLYAREVVASTGPTTVDVYASVRLNVQGRDCVMDVIEVPNGVPPLLGQVPLELLDFVVDPGKGALVGNPLHGGEYILEMY